MNENAEYLEKYRDNIKMNLMKNLIRDCKNVLEKSIALGLSETEKWVLRQICIKGSSINQENKEIEKEINKLLCFFLDIEDAKKKGIKGREEIKRITQKIKEYANPGSSGKNVEADSR